MPLKEFTDKTITNDGSVTLEDLINAFLSYQERINYLKPVHTKITKKEINVEDRIVSIKEKLHQKKKMDFLELFDTVTKEYVVVTFLAILQMNKNNEINIYQEKNFENILIESK